MIRVLILEDDDRKFRRIVEQLRARSSLGATFAPERAATISSAVTLISAVRYDVLVLDLHIPMRDGEDPAPGNALNLLWAIRSGAIVKRPVHIVGLTEYVEARDACLREFNENLWSILIYSESCDDWVAPLCNLVDHVLSLRVVSSVRAHGCDILVLTAMPSVELEAVLALPVNWATKVVDADSASYWTSSWSRGGALMSVVATSCPEVGMPSAAAVAAKCVEIFRPRLLVMLGIAAGVGGRFGDILVAEQCFDYGSGKLVEPDRRPSGFWPAAFPLPLDPGLKATVAWFATKKGVLARIRDGYSGSKPETDLEVRIGAIASGAAVVSRRDVIEEIHARERKVVGVEMEAYGVFQAARQARIPRPLALAIKSVCDFGDKQKGDDYQRYAAYSSARFFFDMATNEPLWAM